MKNNFSFLFVFLFLTTCHLGRSQVTAFMEIDITYPSTYAASDGKIVPHLEGNYPYNVSYHYDMNYSGSFTQQDSLINLDSLWFSNGGFLRYVAIDDATGDTLGIVRWELNGWMFEPSYYVGTTQYIHADSLLNPLTSSSCNGSMDVDHQLFGLFGVAWKDAFGSVNPYIQIANLDSLEGFQMCPGVHLITGFSADNINTYNHYFSVYFEPQITPNASFNIYANTIPSSASSCTGEATAIVSGATSPFQYYWDGILGTSIETGLCPGMHNLKVIDANTDSVSTVFAIADSANFFVYNNSLNPADTVVIFYENCTYDYNIPTDSGTVDLIDQVSNDSVAITFSLWQGGVPTTMVDTVYFNSTGAPAWYIDITVYCYTKAIGSDIVKTIHSMDKTTNGLEFNTASKLIVYPNPASDLVNIQGDIIKVEMYNSLGQLMLSSKDNSFDVSKLPTGLYQLVIVIDNEGNSVTKKLVIK